MPQAHRTSRKTVAQEVPSFFLYGEPPRRVDHRFLHLEELDDRSRPNDWNIRVHAHRNLHHLLFIQTGAGKMSADDRHIRFKAPALLLVPARCVHGFAWHPESTGRVLTLSEHYLGELVARETGLRPLFARADTLALRAGSDEHTSLAETLDRLSRELSWSALGSNAAIEACLTTILIETMRLSKRKLDGAPPGRQAEIVAAFRKAIEDNFHKSLPLTAYARLLGLNVWQLRAACLKAARQPPLAIVQDRKLLEAQRLLLYSNMTVSEAAYHLGFNDPAYFSRMFSRLAGESPRAFRARHTATRG